MGNEFISIKNIARQLLPRLIENLVFPNLVHKDYSETFVNGQGTTIQVKKPVILEARDFDESTGTSPQDVKEKSVEVTLDKLATVDVEFGAIQSATSVDDLNRLFIEPAAVALAQKINADGLELYKDIPYIGGTAGSTPDALSDLTSARKLLNINKAPVTPRYAIWDPEAEAKFLELDTFVEADKSGTTEALRNGSLGRIMGFENFMSQAVKTHTKGTLAAGGTNGKITVKTAVTSKTAVDLDVTASSNGTLTGTVKKGDILIIDGQARVVTADAAADNNEITVNVYPAITVAADREVVVTANHTANLAFHPSAFAFVTRPLAAPAGVESYVTSYNGITLRVVRGYDMKYKKDMLSMDVLYGYKTMYPELAVRYLG
jgi:hypothetical protein